MTASTPENVWDRVWVHENDKPLKEDPMCFFLALVVQNAMKKAGAAQLESAIEMGAGSGRTSRYLNDMGATTGILDISDEALKLCRFANQNTSQPVNYYRQDLFQISS